MAAKKKSTSRARARKEPQSPQQPPAAGAPPEEVLAPPAAAAPVPGQSQPRGPAVVGMGASAGGLDAFKRFFTAMPPDSGIAFVLVPHLDPAHESLMVELLARHTTMPVVEAANDMPVKPNHVYIIPPNKYMTIHAGVLGLTGPVERHESQTSIDLFLRSLAADQQERSICIILSGTGSHGALGLKAVKAAGGMAMVQDPATAEYDRMPQSAIATGLADYVLPAEQMPDALIQYVQHAYLNGGTRIEAAPEVADQLTQVLTLLRTRSKFDFRAYRKKMLTRRIERRMGLNRLDSIPDYMAFLRSHPDELKLLIKDLFISVTSFFRDSEAFEQLARHVIAPMVESKEDDAVIRVWVPGCATGEEPYSIAMLFQERLAAARKSCRVQIFATDVDEDALEVARQGLYPESIVADVSPERLARFFTKMDEHTYQVSKPVREPVIFAPQNLISDAPFTKLDLISCRNLLIYLEPEVQKKVLTLFHFALNRTGFLFLGPSETIGRQIDQFEPLSKKWRVYRRIGPLRPERVDFPIAAATEVHGPGRQLAGDGGVQQVNFAELSQRILLEQFAPAAVLIGRNYEIFYYFGPCTNYLEFPTGQPTHDLTLMAREGLRNRLRGAVHRAVRDNDTVVVPDIQVKRNGGYCSVRLTVRPVQMPKAPDGLLLVTFEDTPSAPPSSPPARAAQAEPADESILRQLEYELKVTREDLQSTIEEMESSNEELKASNEEVMSMNEELQSANEELETSKEELQSLNEELGTVNNHLQDKVEELEDANNDMSNLLNCTDIATVFLDPDLRIKLFTPAATRLFNLIASDVGRPLGDITPQFKDPDLLADAGRVLQQLVPREREVSTGDGCWWIRRIVPYRTTDNRIDGVITTFVDITERKQAADAVVRHLAAIVESSADAIFSKDLDGTIRTWNQGAERLYGYTQDEAVGQSVAMLTPDDHSRELAAILAKLKRGQSVIQMETERVRKDGQRLPVSLTVSPLRDSAGKVVSASVISRDIGERKRAEAALRESEKRFRFMADAAPVMVWMSGTDKLCTWASKSWLDFVGRPLERELGNGWTENIHADDADRCLRTYNTAFDARQPFSMEYRLRRHDGEYRWLLDHGTALYGEGGVFTGYIGSCVDITERRKAEESVAATYRHLKLAMSAARMAAWTWDPGNDVASTTENFQEIYGLSTVHGLEQGLSLVHPEDRSRHRETVAHAVDHAAPYHSVYRIIRPDNGQVVWLDERAVPVTDSHGHFMALSGVVIDITERKQAEQALQDKEERLQAILDTAMDAIITIDPHGIIQSVNAAAERMFGYTAAEMLGQNVKMLMAPPYREVHDSHLARYLKTREKHIIGISREVEARRKDGSIFPTDLAVSEIAHLKLFTGIHRDLTERKQLERDVVEAASLEQRRIGQDLHDTVAQELTALNILAGDLAETLPTDPARAAQLVEQMTQGLQRSRQELRAVLRGLLPVAVDSEGLMAALADLAERTQQEGKVSCVFDCPMSVSVAENVTATQLYLIAQEAVHNAVKHANARTVRIRLKADGGLGLSVQDDGIGMPSGSPESHGLGLRIMHNRAAIIGAKLTLEPARPTGTVVTCALPRSRQ
jgi:two-component system CheB/CheR fusion protein